MASRRRRPPLVVGIRERLPVKDDADALFAVAALGLFDYHDEIDGRHDGVAEMLVHPPLDRRSIDINRFVQPIIGVNQTGC